MSSPTEQQLRDLLATEAAAAPRAVGLAEGALRKVRHRRRVRTAWATGLVTVAAMSTGLLTIEGLGQRPVDSAVAVSAESTGERSPTSSDPASNPAGTPVDGATTECVEEYSPAAVAGRAFAFDGTVTAIGPARSNRPGVELELSGVTFRVHNWFRGGSGDVVTVDLDTPRGTLSSAEPSAPAYEIGTRLLVSGEPRWGGLPLDAPIASSCGFTRSYDARTAAEWSAATD